MTGVVSVILPIRGEAPFLADALASLAVQAEALHEVLAVDDGMSDAARAALGRARLPGLRILQGPRRGPAAARNVALAAAAGPVIGFLDDDDLWPADKLARQLAHLARRPGDVAVGGRIEWFARWDGPAGRPLRDSAWQSVVHVNLGAYLFRREVFERLGPLDSTLTFSEDVDLILRLSDAGERFAILDRTTLYYRRHPGSMTAARSAAEERDFRRVLLRSVRRRRLAGGLSAQSLAARLVPAEEEA
ncbi:MAG: glycosyltransferase family 2 protein [Acetobacteraceae bacterium]|nr:glycosyltransferase family 2 protein [Acetobacteraceae bacterium]MDW8400051.1 glycosyltransferase family A protein [Acetobacteraceae bacterium]